MFLESLLETSASAKRRRSCATLISFLIETTALGLLIVVPLLYTNALPSLAYAGGVPLLAPPRGAPAPEDPPEPAGQRKATPQPASDFNDRGALVEPRAVPPEVWKPKPGEDSVSAPPASCSGCIPGAIGNGPANPLLTKLISPPPEASAPPPKAPVVVPSVLVQGLLIHRVDPVYPRLAIIAHLQGPVVLRAIIGRDGAIQQLRTESGHPWLAEAAAAAVRQWRYRPYILNGHPVDVETQVTVNFVLNR